MVGVHEGAEVGEARDEVREVDILRGKYHSARTERS